MQTTTTGALFDQIHERLGENGGLTIETNLKTTEGTLLTATWVREGQPGRRHCTAQSLDLLFRRILFFEDEVDGVNDKPIPAETEEP